MDERPEHADGPDGSATDEAAAPEAAAADEAAAPEVGHVEVPHVEVSTDDLPYGSGKTRGAPHQWALLAIVAAAVVVVDQVTKAWAVDRLSDFRVRDSIGSLQFRLTHNTGAAFSVGSGRGIGPLVTVLALGVITYLVLSPTTRRPSGAVAVGLVAGGAIGNLLDRAFRSGPGFMRGGVVDFIDLQWWPVFNVADAAVVVGAVTLAIVAIRHPD